MSSINYFILILYVIPAILCFIGYSIRTVKNILKDYKRSKISVEYYTPRETIGSVFARLAVCFVPGINLFALFIDLLFPILERTGKLLRRITSTPIIRKKSN